MYVSHQVMHWYKVAGIYLWAEDGGAVAGYILFVALVEVTLSLRAVTALTRTFTEGQVGTAAGVG